jgi:hypothetical protein
VGGEKTAISGDHLEGRGFHSSLFEGAKGLTVVGAAGAHAAAGPIGNEIDHLLECGPVYLNQDCCPIVKICAVSGYACFIQTTSKEVLPKENQSGLNKGFNG